MFNRLSLRLFKFLVDFTYYALPILAVILKAVGYAMIASAVFLIFVMIL